MTIVGVIRNERVQRDLRAPVDEIAYVPIAQAPRMQVKLSVHTVGDAAATVPAIREAVRQTRSVARAGRYPHHGRDLGTQLVRD